MNAIEYKIKGIKCDNPNCDYQDTSVKYEDYPIWLNMPCPKCRENLLTQRDFDTVKVLFNLFNFINHILKPFIFLLRKLNRQEMSVKFDGTGKINVTVKDQKGLIKMNTQEILLQPFDIETHKNNFINYLEVILLEDGTIVYATPSRQEKLISIAMKKLGITRESLNDLCPKEYYFNFMTWLSQMTNCVAIWSDYIVGAPNELQLSTLYKLQKEELYTGSMSFGQ